MTIKGLVDVIPLVNLRCAKFEACLALLDTLRPGLLRPRLCEPQPEPETAVACVPRSCGHGLADLRPVVDESSGGAGCAGAEQPGEDTDTDWEHALNTMLGGTLGGPGPSRFPGLPAPLAF